MLKLRKSGCRTSIILFIAVTFISCASISPSIPSNALQAVKRVDIYVGHPRVPLVYQRQVKGAKAGAMLGGLVGILVAETISRSTNTKWEESGKRIAAHLEHLDHINLLEQDLNKGLARSGVEYNIHRVDELHDLFQRDEIIENILQFSEADIVVVLSYDYLLQQGFDLHVSGHSEIYAVSDYMRRFADSNNRIVYRLIDDTFLLDKHVPGAGTPESIASILMDAETTSLNQQLELASQHVSTEVIAMMGQPVGKHATQDLANYTK